jgi:homoserine kinase
MHQPYRMEACPLLKALLPLADEPWIAGIALSGAGPSVLIFLSKDPTTEQKSRLVTAAGEGVDWLSLRIAGGGERTLL